MIDYEDNIHDLRELEKDEEEAGEALTIDEIDVNTGTIKAKEPLVSKPSEPSNDEYDDDFEEEDEDFFDDDEELPSDDELLALENSLEGGE